MMKSYNAKAFYTYCILSIGLVLNLSAYGLPKQERIAPNAFLPHGSVHNEMISIDMQLSKASTLLELIMATKRIEALLPNNFADTCRKPTWWDIKLWCGDVVTKDKVEGDEAEFYEFIYEKRLWKLACIDAKNDSDQAIKMKIVAWWNKYKLDCKCNSTTFSVPNGNILKWALSERQTDFIEVLAAYGCDVNFIDPADNQNMLDYLNGEIAKRMVDGSSSTTIEIYEKYKRTLISLGAKPSK